MCITYPIREPLWDEDGDEVIFRDEQQLHLSARGDCGCARRLVEDGAIAERLPRGQHSAGVATRSVLTLFRLGHQHCVNRQRSEQTATTHIPLLRTRSPGNGQKQTTTTHLPLL